MSMECEPPLGGLPPPPPLATVAFHPNLEDCTNYQPILSISYPHCQSPIQPRLGSETRLRPPRQPARPPRHRPTTPRGRSRPSLGRKSTDCRSLSSLPLQISLVRDDDDQVRDDNRDFILAHSSRAHCSQRCCESTGGEEAPLIE